MSTCMPFAALIVVGLAGPVFAQGVTTFDNGTEGWSVSGRETIGPDGNPGPALNVTVLEVFGADIRNNTNGSFLGDYSRFGAPLELSVDVKVDFIRSSFTSTDVERNFGVVLRDFDAQGNFLAAVYFPLGTLDPRVNDEWTTYSVVIDDPTSATLPPGWIGDGGIDPDTFEPVLPAGRTFADVLQNVDEIAFTTFEPGFLFGFTDFVMQVDNPGLRVIPSPASSALLSVLAVATVRRRRVVRSGLPGSG